MRIPPAVPISRRSMTGIADTIESGSPSYISGMIRIGLHSAINPDFPFATANRCIDLVFMHGYPYFHHCV
jgi:hypothetical protein